MTTSEEIFHHDEDEVFSTFLEMVREGNNGKQKLKNT
jgi:hypothetical protein